jgi:DNA-binding NarL/FixJ family response regulator
MVKVVIAEPRRLVREAMRIALAAADGLEVVGEAGCVPTLVTAVADLRPDVVLVNLDHDVDGVLAAMPSIIGGPRRVRVVAVVAAADAALARRAHLAGVAALITADHGVQGLVPFVRNPDRAPALRRVSGHVAAAPACDMTPRELEVLRLISLGLTAKEISAEMVISPKTVERHKQRLFRKLNVQNQAHAVSVALRHGFLRPTAELAPAVG